MGLFTNMLIGHAVVKHAVKSANKPSTLDQIQQSMDEITHSGEEIAARIAAERQRKAMIEQQKKQAIEEQLRRQAMEEQQKKQEVEQQKIKEEQIKKQIVKDDKKMDNQNEVTKPQTEKRKTEKQVQLTLQEKSTAYLVFGIIFAFGGISLLTSSGSSWFLGIVLLMVGVVLCLSGWKRKNMEKKIAKYIEIINSGETKIDEIAKIVGEDMSSTLANVEGMIKYKYANGFIDKRKMTIVLSKTQK